MLKTIHIVGLGLGVQDIGPAAQRIIDAADILAGEARLLDLFPNHRGSRLKLDEDGEQWLEGLKHLAETNRVVVLSSGDPNQFDLAERIVAYAGPENVRIHPNVTTFQAAFARLKEPWAGVPVVSFHSQGERELFSAVRNNTRVAVFTDENFTPSRIARILLDRGQTGWRMCVLENLESPDFRVTFHRLFEAAEKDFSPMNLVVLWQKEDVRPLTLGVSEESFECRNDPLLSREVRAVALALLSLGPEMTLWDLGADCGMLGLEATLLLSKGQVYTVESQPDRIKSIETNRTNFGAANLVVIQGDPPQVLNDLPAPDRIFIGDVNTALKETLDACSWRLKSGGIMVVGVSGIERLNIIKKTMTVLYSNPEILQIRITRTTNEDRSSAGDMDTAVWLVIGKN